MGTQWGKAEQHEVPGEENVHMYYIIHMYVDTCVHIRMACLMRARIALSGANGQNLIKSDYVLEGNVPCKFITHTYIVVIL